MLPIEWSLHHPNGPCNFKCQGLANHILLIKRVRFLNPVWDRGKKKKKKTLNQSLDFMTKITNSLKIVSRMTFRYKEKKPSWALQWKMRIDDKNHKDVSLKDMPKMVPETISY